MENLFLLNDIPQGEDKTNDDVMKIQHLDFLLQSKLTSNFEQIFISNKTLNPHTIINCFYEQINLSQDFLIFEDVNALGKLLKKL